MPRNTSLRQKPYRITTFFILGTTPSAVSGHRDIHRGTPAFIWKMKKFVKFLLGLTAVAAAVGGILYFLKNVLMKDYLDDYDDDDFDNDLYDEDDDDRDYVTLSPDEESEEADDTLVPDDMEEE